MVEPRLATPRDLAYPTYGPRVAAMAELMRRPLMPWQRATADVALEYDPDTRLLRHHDLTVLVPRQAGKTTLTGPLMHTVAMMRRAARVYYTAQTGKDAHEWFLNEHLPTLAPLEGRFTEYRSQGSASVTWRHNRSIVRVFAPQRDALHGKQSDLAVIDEAWAHDEIRGAELLQAIGPTQATRTLTPPGAQIWVLSAAGDHTSGFLIARLKAARAQLEAGGAGVLIEYGVPDGMDATDVDVVADHHPAVGLTIDRGYLTDERNRLGPEGFARAYGCYQVIPEAVTLAAIDMDAWTACEWFAEIPADDVVVAFAPDITPDRSLSSIVAATRSGILEVVDSRPGTEWVAGRLMELSRQWRAVMVVDQYAATANVVDDVRKARLERAMIVPSVNDVVVACQGFYDDVLAVKMKIRPHADLTDAARAATTRRVSDGWVWNRRQGGAPIAPLVAASLAWWGAGRPSRIPRTG